jgi:hypothetical protein
MIVYPDPIYPVNSSPTAGFSLAGQRSCTVHGFGMPTEPLGLLRADTMLNSGGFFMSAVPHFLVGQSNLSENWRQHPIWNQPRPS